MSLSRGIGRVAAAIVRGSATTLHMHPGTKVMRFLSIWLCLTLIGCASASGSSDNPFASPRARATRDGPVEVRVENNAYLDMHVYVVYGAGQQRSLGMVTGLTRRTLVVPNQVIQNLSGIQLYADPIGSSRGFMSRPLLAYPGQRIRFTIQNLLSLSTAWVEGRIGSEDDEEEAEDDEEETDGNEAEEPDGDDGAEVEPPNG